MFRTTLSRAAVGLLVSLAVALGAMTAPARPAGASGTSGSVFCQTANAIYGHSVIFAAAPTQAQAQAAVGTLTAEVSVLPVTIANASAALKPIFAVALTDLKAALTLETQVVSTLSLATQNQAKADYNKAVAKFNAAATAVYTSCSYLIPSVASEIGMQVSTTAVSIAAAQHRVVSTADLKTVATHFPGVTLAGTMSASYVAKFHVILAPAVATNFCFTEPSTIGGTPVATGVC